MRCHCANKHAANGISKEEAPTSTLNVTDCKHRKRSDDEETFQLRCAVGGKCRYVRLSAFGRVNIIFVFKHNFRKEAASKSALPSLSKGSRHQMAPHTLNIYCPCSFPSIPIQYPLYYLDSCLAIVSTIDPNCNPPVILYSRSCPAAPISTIPPTFLSTILSCYPILYPLFCPAMPPPPVAHSRSPEPETLSPVIGRDSRLFPPVWDCLVRAGIPPFPVELCVVCAVYM